MGQAGERLELNLVIPTLRSVDEIPLGLIEKKSFVSRGLTIAPSCEA